MDDSLGVSRIQRVRYLYAEIEHSFDLQGFSSYQVLESLSPQQFHRNESPTAHIVDFVDGADIRMAQGGCRSRFTPEPLQRLWIIGEFFWQEL